MGSKRKLLDNIWDVSKDIPFESVIDLFSGSGVVSYMYKAHGKRIVSCDFMQMNTVAAKCLVENNSTILPEDKAKLLIVNNGTDNFVSSTFNDIFYSADDNSQIDIIRHNISHLENDYEKAIALYALIRACTKKRPRGIFTYTGIRYDDGRADLKLSIYDQFIKAVNEINAAVFSNGKRNRSVCGDSLLLRANADLIYIDPPYFNPSGDNDYVRRYHFLEGLARDWNGVSIDFQTKTHKFPSYKSQFSTKDGTYKAFDDIFQKYKGKYMVVSYSSNSLPTLDEMIALMKKHMTKVDVVPIDYRYNFANQEINKKNNVQEYLFVGRR
jgi:DNA adenine methylase